MITDRIKALFRFIEYLHININNFTQFEPAIIELDVLRKERNKLKPNSKFTDRVKENELQLKINDKIDIIEKSIFEPIQKKAKELNICDPNKTETIWNWNISDIEKLKRNFNEKDVPIIIRYKNKYIEFREKVNLSPEEIFFERLDETLRILFDYFNETEESEFDIFNTKKNQVKNVEVKKIPQTVNITTITPPKSIVKEIIIKIFNSFDSKGWKYAFRSEEDFGLFTDLLTNFFENKPYTIPENIIQLKISTKTRVAKALNEIHRELSKEKKLKKDEEYFNIIKMLSHFKDEPTFSIYKALTR